jgi:hypothetical protein
MSMQPLAEGLGQGIGGAGNLEGRGRLRPSSKETGPLASAREKAP